MKKWKIGLIAGSGVIVTSLGSAVLFNGFAHGEWDLPGLNQQVQHVTEVTDNHEARITNLEGKADTPADQPTPTPQVVTKVVTQAAPSVLPQATVAPVVQTAGPTPVPTPEPVHVVAWSAVHVDASCSGGPYTYYLTRYSDGTSKRSDTRLPEDTDATHSLGGSSEVCNQL